MTGLEGVDTAPTVSDRTLAPILWPVPLKNTLYYGDNLVIMREKIPSQSVDLIYLDPPFKSDQNYNMIYKTLTGLPLPEQAEAFCDTWDMDAEKAELAKRIPQMMAEAGVEDYYITFWTLWVNALQKVQPHLLAYLIYMVQRLIYMKPILKPTGSIYLHCDPTASHYIKVMMDGIFGHQNFRNEIIWKRTSAHSDSKRWGAVHDTILFYSKGDRFTWNPVYLPHDPKYVEKQYRFTDARGRYRMHEIVRTASMGERPNLVFEYKGYTPEWGWRRIKPKIEALDLDGRMMWSQSGRPYLKRYLHEQKGNAITDVVVDISNVGAMSKDRMGYPTQKPKPLLQRIIEASSNKGDVIFDPFCGCGTTIYATQELGHRTWIGCDVAILAIKIIRESLTEKYRLSEGTDYIVDGIPPSVEAAKELFETDAHQFQHWAVERAGGFPLKKRGADKGIDGRIYFESKPGLKSMVISVKGGNTGPAHVRELSGTVMAEADAELGGFICLHEPTKAMRAAAAEAGTYTYSDVEYPRVQVLSIREILEDKREFKTPTKIGSRIATGQKALSFE